MHATIPESKKNHIWRKVIWFTDPDEAPLGPYHSVEVYCSEEANGYAVWYVRKLAHDDVRGAPGVNNGDYLLNYFPKTGRDDAIERAVLLAHSAPTLEGIIVNLDKVAAAAHKV